MKNKISASLMCADFWNLKESITLLEKYNIDFIHIDIMDGVFVPNLGIGCDCINSIRKHTKLSFDYHIMAKEPESIIGLLDIKDGDLVSVHYESSPNIQKSLEKLKQYNCKAMIAINPITALSSVEEIFDFVDGINLLMVNPGFAGQKILKNCLEKAKRLGEIIKGQEKDIIFEVDGNISFEYASILKDYGANLFVGGTSSIFSNSNMEDSIKKLQTILN